MSQRAGDGRVRFPAILNGDRIEIVGQATPGQVELVIDDTHSLEIQEDVFRSAFIALNVAAAAKPSPPK